MATARRVEGVRGAPWGGGRLRVCSARPRVLRAALRVAANAERPFPGRRCQEAAPWDEKPADWREASHLRDPPGALQGVAVTAGAGRPRPARPLTTASHAAALGGSLRAQQHTFEVRTFCALVCTYMCCGLPFFRD